MAYDPTIFLGTAAYYARGRPGYSRELVPTLAAELGLDGSGRMLDVGCGPGVLALAFANHFAEVIALDPNPEMLAEGARRAGQAGITNTRWVQALAEDLAALELGQFRLVTFGQSFHWTDRERVAEMVYDMLAPGGALALIWHEHAERPRPSDLSYLPLPDMHADLPRPNRSSEPPIPHELIRALIARYLGPQRRAGQGFATFSHERFEETLARTRFGAPRQILCPGRPDILQDVDGVIANYFSMSFAAPHLFGDRLAEFEAELRAELATRSASGLFWDWPGDTGIVLATKPSDQPSFA